MGCAEHGKQEGERMAKLGLEQARSPTRSEELRFVYQEQQALDW